VIPEESRKSLKIPLTERAAPGTLDREKRGFNIDIAHQFGAGALALRTEESVEQRTTL
jgi:hypothetical protein